MQDSSSLLSSFGIVIFSIIVIVVIFLLLREFWCWFFKINQIVYLLREIRDSFQRGKKKEEDLSDKTVKHLAGQKPIEQPPNSCAGYSD